MICGAPTVVRKIMLPITARVRGEDKLIAIACAVRTAGLINTIATRVQSAGPVIVR